MKSADKFAVTLEKQGGALNVPGGASGTNVIATAYSNNRSGLPGGAAERPASVVTSADGFGTLEISGNTLTFNLGYRGLSDAATAAHIHGPANSSGATGVLLDLAPFNGGAFGVSGTLIGSVAISADVKAAILSGLTYVNIHTMANGGGEVRGQVGP